MIGFEALGSLVLNAIIAVCLAAIGFAVMVDDRAETARAVAEGRTPRRLRGGHLVAAFLSLASIVVASITIRNALEALGL